MMKPQPSEEGRGFGIRDESQLSDTFVVLTGTA
jgi:hypothetical protein